MTDVRCAICGEPSSSFSLMCGPCSRSYDRARSRDDGSVWAAMAWAARRARVFERARKDRLVRGETMAHGRVADLMRRTGCSEEKARAAYRRAEGTVPPVDYSVPERPDRLDDERDAEVYALAERIARGAA